MSTSRSNGTARRTFLWFRQSPLAAHNSPILPNPLISRFSKKFLHQPKCVRHHLPLLSTTISNFNQLPSTIDLHSAIPPAFHYFPPLFHLPNSLCIKAVPLVPPYSAITSFDPEIRPCIPTQTNVKALRDCQPPNIRHHCARGNLCALVFLLRSSFLILNS